MYPLYRAATWISEKVLSRRFPERFEEPEAKEVSLWMHAASVGEALVASAILKELKLKLPDVPVLLTLQTKTGLERALSLLKGQKNLKVALSPWDGPSTLRKWFETLRPRVFALIETELWPNFVMEAKKSGAAVVLLNGRISKKSFSRYRMVKPLFARVLAEFSLIATISEEDAERFKALGAPEEKTFVVGNAKHDMLFERLFDLEVEEPVRRLGLGLEEIVIVFGSVRGGEEKFVRDVIEGLLKEERLKFVVCPRHPERARSFYEAVSSLGIPVAFYGAEGLSGFKAVVVDQVGPLLSLYALCFAAVVGGGFVPKGGQNPMEPAVLSKPVVFGPHMENFAPEVKALTKAGGGVCVRDASEAVKVLKGWLKNPEEARSVGRRARLAANSLRGASKRYAELLRRLL